MKIKLKHDCPLVFPPFIRTLDGAVPTAAAEQQAHQPSSAVSPWSVPTLTTTEASTSTTSSHSAQPLANENPLLTSQETAKSTSTTSSPLSKPLKNKNKSRQKERNPGRYPGFLFCTSMRCKNTCKYDSSLVC